MAAYMEQCTLRKLMGSLHLVTRAFIMAQRSHHPRWHWCSHVHNGNPSWHSLALSKFGFAINKYKATCLIASQSLALCFHVNVDKGLLYRPRCITRWTVRICWPYSAYYQLVTKDLLLRLITICGSVNTCFWMSITASLLFIPKETPDGTRICSGYHHSANFYKYALIKNPSNINQHIRNTVFQLTLLKGTLVQNYFLFATETNLNLLQCL